MWKQIIFWILISFIALSLVLTRNMGWLNFKTRVFIALLLPILIVFFIIFSSFLIAFLVIIGILILVLVIIGLLFGLFKIKKSKHKV